eukprot:305147-Amphidinium_carterae.1
MKMCCTNFFDDYPALEPDVTAQTAKHAAELFVSILGWKVAEGDKALDFEQSFEVLGIVMEMTWCNERAA